MSSSQLPGGVGADLSEVAPAIAQASGKARRDIAFVPLSVIAFGALGLIASELIRPAAGVASGATVPVSVALAGLAVVLCLTAALARKFVEEAGSRVLLRAYAAAAAVLLVGIAAIAAVDHGLASVAIGAAVIVSPSAGLALPKRWSRAAILAIVAAMLALHAARSEASPLEAASIVGLVITGWVVGLILRRGHRGASRDALLLSRGDQLTGALNRRGFIEALEFELDRAASGHTPVLLLAIGLPEGLAAALDRRPGDLDGPMAHAAATIARELPSGATLGRVGVGKLGILIPGGRSVDAEWFAASARAALEGRVALHVGAASSPDGSAPIGELYDVAEACLLEARRRSPQGVQLSEVFGDAASAGANGRQVHRPPVTYARLREAGGPPASVEPWGIDGQWIFAGLGTVALAGLLFVVGSWLEGGGGLAWSVVVFFGAPWALAVLAVGFFYRHHPRSADKPPLFPILAGSALVIGGIAVAALSSGNGALSPLIAGLYLKAFFDASTFDRPVSRPLGLAGGIALMVVFALGPADALWAAPFEFMLLIGAFALGAVGHDAYEAATSGRLDLARTDPFTGLLDRGGFYEKGEALLASPVPHDRGTFAVVLVDVEPLGPVTRAPSAAPSRTPRRTAAGVVAQYLRDANVVARFGSGDFRAIVRVDGRGDLEVLVDTLRRQVASASSTCRIGGALYGPDGVTLDALLAIASYRARADEELAEAA